MKSPADMRIIQIDLTNACAHSCANCTRFCGHHKTPFFMPPETFRKAVDSMDGFEGMVGIMGGEPTLHPQFAELVAYYASRVPEDKPYVKYLTPARSFVQHRNCHLSSVEHRRGLWSSLGRQYYKNFELIQDTFPYQCINDHQNSGLHQALLMTRKELGIPDEKWIALRDQCWVQNLWSASITPKGAFFCEVAGALDMLFDGPGGWPIEPGWWKRTPDQFGDQLQWCELCSAALSVPRVQANTENDIVSPVMLEKLKGVASPKVAKGNVTVLSPQEYLQKDYQSNFNDPEWYLPAGDNSVRITSTNDSIMPADIGIYPLAAQAGGSGARVITEQEFRTGAFTGWCVATRIPLPEALMAALRSTVLNPGCLHYYATVGGCGCELAAGELAEQAAVLIFHRSASALSAVQNFTWGAELFAQWPSEKRIPLRHFPALVPPVPFAETIKDILRKTPLWPVVRLMKRTVKLVLGR